MSEAAGKFYQAQYEMSDAQLRLYNQLEALKKANDGLPESDEITKDLAKEKTQKDFDKKKRKWEDKLKETEKLRDKAQKVLDEWKTTIHKTETVFEEWEKEKDATDKALREVIAAIDKNNQWLTQLGFDEVKKPKVDSWSEVLKATLEFHDDIAREKQRFKEVDEDMVYFTQPLQNRYRALDEAVFKIGKKK